MNFFRRRVYRPKQPPDCPVHGPLVCTLSGWKCARITCDYKPLLKEKDRK